MKTVKPWLFWKALASLAATFPEVAHRNRATIQLGMGRGQPGSGVIRGRTNIAKTLTYRAVRNIDFNTERNVRRAERRLLVMNVIGDGHDYP